MSAQNTAASGQADHTISAVRQEYSFPVYVDDQKDVCKFSMIGKSSGEPIEGAPVRLLSEYLRERDSFAIRLPQRSAFSERAQQD